MISNPFLKLKKKLCYLLNRKACVFFVICGLGVTTLLLIWIDYLEMRVLYWNCNSN